MRDTLWVAALCLAVIGCGGGETSTAEPPPVPSVDATIEEAYSNGHPLACSTTDPLVVSREDELTALTNDYRVSKGLNALVDDPQLREVARAQCEHMILHGFFAHQNPEGQWPWERASMVGIEFLQYGENLAAGQPTARQAFADLLASAGHRAVIEDPNWTHLGCGFASDLQSRHVYYWAQNFKRCAP